MLSSLSIQAKLVICILILLLCNDLTYINANHTLTLNSTFPSYNSSYSAFNTTIISISEQELNADLMKSENMEFFEQAVYHEDFIRNNSNIGNATRLAIQAKLYLAVYNDLLMQRYENVDDLIQSSGPKANQEICLKNLAHLLERAELQKREQYISRDISLAQLLDTFGRRTSGVYLGTTYWLGSYLKCTGLKINVPNGLEATRYCVAHVRPNSNFSSDSPMSALSALKSGVCLPESCDSLNYKNKYNMIFKLMELNSHDFASDQANLTNLYCLPDRKSPLRTWWRQPTTMTLLVGLCAYIVLVIYATLHEKAHRNQKDNLLSRFCRSLSLRTNLTLLFKTKRVDNTAETDKEGIDAKQSQPAKKVAIVDLNILDGIKVLTIVYIIMGHVIMCMMHMTIINDSQDFTTWFVLSLANMAPAFAVNSFFAVTGLLTTYLMFKIDDKTSIITSPVKWVIAVIYRYLRIMSLYVVVVAYAKYLAKFTGSGPLWDYGTSSLAHRRYCEQESWLVTLLFTSNFKPPNSHCLPVGWYLANDFQFFLVTPIFLYFLKIRPLLGKVLLIISISIGYWAGFGNIYTAELEDLRPIAHFMPHGFKSYSTLMHTSYTRPYNRIPAYLCGLLIGYYLYSYEQRRLKYSNSEEKPGELQVADSTPPPDWPNPLKKYGSAVSLAIIFAITALPYFAYLVPLNKSSARFMMALVVPYNHIAYSFAMSILILLTATGNGFGFLKSFLRSGFWRPAAKLSLCVCLVNCEVIMYITQSVTQFVYYDTVFYAALNLISILACYLVGMILFLLFEAPTRHLLDYVLLLAAKKKDSNS